MRLFEIVFLSLLISSQSSAGEKIQIHDFHFHIHNETTTEQFDKAINNESNFFERKSTLFIDLGYALIDVEHDPHKNLSRLIETSKSPMIKTGLCGTNLRRENAVSEVAECLKLPGMKGVKLHLHPSGILLSLCRACLPGFVSNMHAKLDKIAKEVARVDGFILIHFPHLAHFDTHKDYGAFGTGHKLESNEANAFFKVTLANPKTKFIIAHSGANSVVNPTSLRQFGRYYRANPKAVRNIYAESSVIVGHAQKTGLCFIKNKYEVFVHSTDEVHEMPDPSACADKIKPYAESEESKLIVDAWREFGIDRILFGSDGPAEALALESFQYILQNGYLKDSEKNQIFFENGEKLLSTRPPQARSRK